ncbi:MAG: metal ABC transporter permease [Tissierellia bacterium]|nr:metal ABC transporter permease [Tissierellia bacterium]
MLIFQYSFMIRAFIVGILLATVIPCIGVVLVLRRQSMMGDALSHASLVGVSAGLLTGTNPVVGAVISTFVASLTIEGVRKRIPDYAEMSIAIILSMALALSGILFSFLGNATGFNTFLYGSIVAISDFELYLVMGISLIILLGFTLNYQEFFYLALDERSARLAGIPIRRTALLFTIFTALTVSVASRTIGVLMVSSMMVVPVAASMQLSKSFWQTTLYAILIAVFSMIAGLFLSFYWDLKPGPTVVMVCIFCFLASTLIRWRRDA